MKIAIMQPYLFPYIGYFQMIHSVNQFVLYDDVNFVKKGWINRNRILVNGSDYLFTLPLYKVSQNNLICESIIHRETFLEWKKKFLQTIEFNYIKAPYYFEINNLLIQFFNKDYESISELAIDSVILIADYLKIDTKFLVASQRYQNRGLERQKRLIDICKLENTKHYINAIGGQELYNPAEFALEGIKLDFIKSKPIIYKQFQNEFIPWLSIIDVLMFNTVEEINIMLNQFELI
jgi:hypothetical protein